MLHRSWFGRLAIVLFGLIVSLSSYALEVKTVPWVAANPLIPHDTWSGKSITLKGTADSQGSNIHYTWDYGDGSPVTTGTVTNRYNISVKHAYVGVPGDVFSARLTIEDMTTGETASKAYYVAIQQRTLAVEANVAIDEGLWYLYTNENFTTNNGVDYGDWHTNSCMACDPSYYGVTAENINAFEANGHLADGPSSDPYTEAVASGMRSLFKWLTTEKISNVTYPSPTGTVNPDSNGNGYGVRVNQTNYVYQGGMFIDAIVTSGTPDQVTTTGQPASGSNPGILGRTYKSIVQDMVDAYAYGQYNANSAARGGWRYSWNSLPDNSVSQWAAIGIIPAERNWDVIVPPWVQTENEHWLAYSQAANGSFGYQGPSPAWGPYATSPSGMVQMVMDGMGRGNAQWDNAESFIRSQFANTSTSAAYAIKSYYYGLFSFVKSMRLSQPEIKLLGGDLDWYGAQLSQGDPTDGVARTLIDSQNPEGYWTQHEYYYQQYPFDTAWAILMLGQTLFASGSPVAVAVANPNPAVAGEQITLDGSGSFHQDPNHHIVAWDWDFNNDGTFDASGAQVTTSFPAVGDYPVTLRVTDDSVPPKTATTEVTVRVTIPPVPPTANAGGPYVFCPGTNWYLDGSQSVLPDAGQSEVGQPGDTIQSYAWDLNGNNQYTDATGVRPQVNQFFAGYGVGDYLVKLKVTDTTATSFPSSGMGDLSSTAYAQVSIKDASDAACNCLTDLAARAKSGKVQLTWTYTGANHYNIYRSTTSGGPYTKIGTTTSTYSVYIDFTVKNDTRYYYVVRAAAANGNETCQSIEVSAEPTANFFSPQNAPVITSNPVTNAVEGQTYTYAVQAVDAENGTLTYGLSVAPTGMSIDPSTGVITWIPINAQVGTQNVSLYVTDPTGLSVSQTYQVTVANANHPPQFVSSPVTTATEGQAYTYTAQAIDQDAGDTQTYSVSSGPTGLSIDPQTGVVSWTPTSAQVGNQTVTLKVTDSGGLSDTQTFTIAVKEANKPPYFTSTPITTATQGSLYTYDANASDPNIGDTLTYSLVTPPEGVSIDASTGLISWTPDATQTGHVTLQVMVQDQGGLSALQTFIVHVAYLNKPPSITSTPVASTTEGLLYQYPVTATDPNLSAGDVLTFSLDAAPSGMTIDPTSGMIQWIASKAQVGNQTVTVRVTDAEGLYDTQTYTLAVANLPTAPSIVSAPIVNAAVGQSYQYQVNSTDPDVGDTATYSLTTAPAGMTIDSSSGLIQWTPTSAQLGNQNVAVLVTDSTGLTGGQNFTVAVSNTASAPTITSTPTGSAVVGQVYGYQVAASELDSSATFTYSLDTAPTGMAIDATSGLVTWTPDSSQVGTNAVTVRITDNSGGYTTQSFNLTVNTAPDTPPTITSLPSGAATELVLYSYQVVASDPDAGDTITYSLDTAPTGMTIDATSGLIQWTPGSGQLGVSAVKVRATDSHGGYATQSFGVTVNSTPDTPPSITSTPTGPAVVGVAYSYQVTATDPDVGDTVTYSLDTFPAGMSINASTGLVQWTPTVNQEGSSAVTVRATDSHGGYATQSFSLTAVNPSTTSTTTTSSVPTITSQPSGTAVVSQVYSYQVAAIDTDNSATISYSLDTAPSGMTIDAASGLVQWTPLSNQAGANTVTVRATDSNGGYATQTFTLTVNTTADNPPVITSTAVTSGQVGSVYSYQVTASDPDAGDTITYSLDAAPSGMSINATSGLIQWTPTNAQQGTNAVTVRATDSYGGYSTQSFGVNVTASTAGPSITSTPVTSAVVDKTYQYTVTATDPNGKAIGYSLVAAPTGMTINASTGVISWTPSTSGSEAVSVRATNTAGQYTTQSYTITVTDVAISLSVLIQASPSVISAGGSSTISVSTAGGVQGNIALSMTVDGNPVALDSNGQAVVTSNVIGGHTVIVTATDPYQTVTKTFYFSVSDPSDTTPPTVDITSPATGSTVTAPVDIVGTANDANLVDYQLLMAPAGTTNYTTLNSGTTPVVNGVLGQFDPTQLENGQYDIVLIATDTNGVKNSALVTYTVSGKMKVGNFSITLEDLNIPVGGIPITVSRTYSTLRKNRSMDFGYGWSVNYQNVKIEENQTLGNNWTMTSTGGLLPTYCIEPSGGHIVTVTMPNGKVDKFTMSVTPECNAIIPSTYDLNAVFTALPGTSATLTDTDGTVLAYDGGTLLDILGTAESYSPNHYTLKTASGYTYKLDQNFGITEIIDPNGNKLTYGRDGISDGAGDKVSFTRDGQGRITAITDLDGKQIKYSYDANGNLASVTDRDGNVTRMHYDLSHRLTDYINPQGIVPARNIYDDKGRLVAYVDAQGRRTDLTHNLSSHTEAVTDPYGHTLFYTYDNDGNIISRTDAEGHTTSYTYDAQNRLTSTVIPSGQTASTTYNSDGKILSKTDFLGYTKSYTYSTQGKMLTETDANGNVTTYTYDANGNPLTKTDALGGVTTSVYDGSGNVIKTTDALGNVVTNGFNASGYKTSSVDALGVQTNYGYDANGNLLQQSVVRTDTAGVTHVVTTHMAYDNSGNVVSKTDADGYTAKTAYNSLNKVSAKVDKDGNRTTYGYDVSGNLTVTTYPDGTQKTATYDAAGNKISSTNREGQTTDFTYNGSNKFTKIVYPDGSSLNIQYDANGNVTSKTNGLNETITNTYDSVGNLISKTDALGNVTSFTYDGNHNRTSMTDANGNTTQYQYDALNHLVRTTYPNGTSKSVTYDALGHKLTQTDQAGNKTSYKYDADGYLIQVTDALGNVTKYTYDEVGNKLSQTDANGHVTTWNYDNMGHVLNHTLPGGQSESFTYDGNGNVLSHTDFNGNTTSYAYDSDNQQTSINYPDGSSVSLTYTPSGKIASSTDSFGKTTYVYDSRDRLMRLTYPDGNFIAYTYDALSNILTVTTASGTTTNTYDADNRLLTVTDQDGGVTTYTYDAVGNRTSMTYPDGTVATYTYDALNRLTHLENRRADSSIISSYDYQLGPTGNRVQITEDTGRTSAYTYDADYRLMRTVVTTASGTSSTTAYTYDAVGNRLTKTVDGVETATYTYDADDRLLSDGTNTYTYDDNGNTLSKTGPAGTTSYQYDYANRLVGVTSSTGTTAYAYTAGGQRRQQVVNGVVTNYVVDPNRRFAQVLEERDASNNLVVRYTYGSDLISQTRGTQTRYYHYDGQGSTRALTDASGATTDTYTYDAFGNLSDHTGSTVNAYLYTGQRYDPNVGFYYLRSRYYNPVIGRFMNRDTWAGDVYDPRTLHKYVYVYNDPVNLTDPTGRFGLASVSLSIDISINLDIEADVFTLMHGGAILLTVEAMKPGFAMQNDALQTIASYGNGLVNDNALNAAFEEYRKGGELIEMAADLNEVANTAIDVAEIGVSTLHVVDALEESFRVASYAQTPILDELSSEAQTAARYGGIALSDFTMAFKTALKDASGTRIVLRSWAEAIEKVTHLTSDLYKFYLTHRDK